jgi:flagellin
MFVADLILDTISSERGKLGAAQNRLASTVANLGVVAEKVSDAKSRIMDADFAAETANLTKNQILQQAGIAMLAQANARPQAVLQLLQG